MADQTYAEGAQQDWRQRLREEGHRLTPQRELVLRAVDELGHATPDEVLRAVREQSPGVNISTVYRTLELLEELDLVRHAHLTDRAPTYHSATAPPHAHLVCRECGQVREADGGVVGALTTGLRDREGFATDVGHLTVFGICRNCRGSGSHDQG